MNTEDARQGAKHDRGETRRERECTKEIERHQQDTLNSLVREQLITTLGKPDDLLSVQIKPLWGTNFRANVFVGANVACARITHSFFLVTNDDGVIVKSTPTMKRVY